MKNGQRPRVSAQAMNEAQNKMFRQVIDSLAGPSDEEFDKKFQELANTAGTAANAGRDKEAGRAAWTMLLMAGAKALKSPGPDLRLAREASRCESAGASLDPPRTVPAGVRGLRSDSARRPAKRPLLTRPGPSAGKRISRWHPPKPARPRGPGAGAVPEIGRSTERTRGSGRSQVQVVQQRLFESSHRCTRGRHNLEAEKELRLEMMDGDRSQRGAEHPGTSHRHGVDHAGNLGDETMIIEGALEGHIAGKGGGEMARQIECGLGAKRGRRRLAEDACRKSGSILEPD